MTAEDTCVSNVVVVAILQDERSFCGELVLQVDLIFVLLFASAGRVGPRCEKGGCGQRSGAWTGGSSSCGRLTAPLCPAPTSSQHSSGGESGSPRCQGLTGVTPRVSLRVSRVSPLGARGPGSAGGSREGSDQKSGSKSAWKSGVRSATGTFAKRSS
ncbi:hypothetical protein NDU88_007469 [Pleurodeles waltl]|uniref:Uncharacterized protein n=1 Tax=Pleurodeles waltl TaxID=8319 RepID=A0AAV7VTY2_PLEWA|nr:hypothetical protein NDU88_007469 [Pleurodeles waltl]